MSGLTPSVLNEELEVLQEILAILTKSLLHHKEYIQHGNALFTNKQRLYSVLGDIFDKWGEHMQIVNQYAITEEQLSKIIEWCMTTLSNNTDSLHFATALTCTEQRYEQLNVITNVDENNVSRLIAFIDAAPFVNVEEVIKGLLPTHSYEKIKEITKLCKIIQNKYRKYTEHKDEVNYTLLEGSERRDEESHNAAKWKDEKEVNVIIITSILCSLLPSYNLTYTLSSINKIIHNVKEYETSYTNTSTSSLMQIMLVSIVYIWSFANNTESNSNIPGKGNVNNELSTETQKFICKNVNNEENTLQNIAYRLINDCSTDKRECEELIDEVHSTNNNNTHTSISVNTTETASEKATKRATPSFLTLPKEISSLLQACSVHEQQELSQYFIETHTRSVTQHYKELTHKTQSEHNDHTATITHNELERNELERSHDNVSIDSDIDEADRVRFWHDLTS